MKIQMTLRYMITTILMGIVAGAVSWGLTYLVLHHTSYNFYINVALATAIAAATALLGSMVPLEGADFGSVIGVGIGSAFGLIRMGTQFEMTVVGVVASLGALLVVMLYEKYVESCK